MVIIIIIIITTDVNASAIAARRHHPSVNAADESLLKSVSSDSYHVLHRLLPEEKTSVPYTLGLALIV